MSDTKKNEEMNILSPLVDCLWQCGSIIWKILSNNPNKIDWREEFLALDIKNKDEETPRLVSCTEDEYIVEYLFYLPKGLTVEKVEKAISRVTTLSKKEEGYVTVKRYLDKAKIVVDKGVFEKELFRFEDFDFVPKKNSLELPVGYYLKEGKKQLLLLDLTSSTQCHVLVGGSSGYGKSNVSKCILSAITKFYSPKYIKYKVADLKGTELPIFANTEHCESYTDSAEETVTFVKELIVEMDNRYSILKKANCKDIKEYHSRGNEMPYMMLFIDEFSDLTLLADSGDIDESVISDLARLLQKGRSAGIICIFTLQTAKATMIPTEIRNNIPVTIGLGCRDGNQSKCISGDSMILAELRKRPAGLCLLFGLPRFDETTLIRTIYMPEKDALMKDILKPFFKKPTTTQHLSNSNTIVCENVITKKVSGFDLDKNELFASFQPKPKKQRKSHGAKKVKLDKFDNLN